ncbi:MAG TPA: replication-associated recombination protein A [Actinomycetota bacterium]|nr:replication-associated recombination protein A [Actinomycetota bacterium]
MDLFEHQLEERFDQYAPLAARMRPRSVDEVVGQPHLLGPGKALRALIESGEITSIILWGPAGSGKTTLAHVIANATDAHFEPLSAVTAGVADVRKVIQQAKDRLAEQARRTVLFLDEIHRFNKAQQDALLPAVENGWIVLVGATTENPSFEVNSPLMSRSTLFRLEALSEDDLKTLLQRALADAERGLANSKVEVEDDALDHIAHAAGGDARTALNALETAALIAATGTNRIDLAVAEEGLQRRALPYDKAGDWHYDTISAFIKSMRDSDPDAAVYWMTRMLDAGEDPRFIARRMVILASEDIGNADPTALQVAVSAFQALEFIGLPEAKLNLAQAAVYLALAPKSNASAVALWRAEADVAAGGPLPVPNHLRDSHAVASRMTGAGRGYKYAHDHGGYVAQQHLPDSLKDRRYFEAITGAEKDLEADLEAKRKGAVDLPPSESPPEKRPKGKRG